MYSSEQGLALRHSDWIKSFFGEGLALLLSLTTGQDKKRWEIRMQSEPTVVELHDLRAFEMFFGVGASVGVAPLFFVAGLILLLETYTRGCIM